MEGLIHLLSGAAGTSGGFSLIHLLLALFLAWISGEVVARMGYPAVLGELAAGILFGPAILGWIQPSEGLATLAEVGVFLLMLYIGMEMDYTDILREARPGFWATLGGVVVPFVTGFLIGQVSGRPLQENLVIATTFAVTALATKSRILVDLNLLGTRLASVLIATALTTDILALVVLAVVYTLIQTGSFAVQAMLITLLHAGAFFAGAVLLGHYGLPLLARFMNRLGFQGRTVNFTLLLIVALVYAEMAELAGMHAILGAFIAGLFIREAMVRRKLSHELREMVHDLSVGFLAPVFFIYAGFDVNLQSVFQALPFFLLILVGATVSKILGTMALYALGGYPWREGLVLGSALNGRGAVGIIVAQIGLEAGVLDPATFSSLVLMAFFTTLSVPVLLKWGVAWLRRRGELEASRTREGVLIVGASPVGLLLARAFEGTGTMLVDANPDFCEEAERLGFLCVQGNALKEEILEHAGAERARTLIVITPNTETNVLIARFARETFLIPEVYVLVEADHKDALWEPVREEGLIPFNFGAFTLGEWNRWVQEGRTEPSEVGVTASIRSELFLETVYQHDVVLPLTVVRDGTPVFFYALEKLQTGDRVRTLRLVEPAFGVRDDLDLLIERAEVVDFREGGQEEVFARLAEIFSREIRHPRNDLLERFRAREQELSTWVAPGLAIPHIVVPGSEQFALAIARSEEGITWGDPDRKVHAIFAFVSTLDHRLLHLRILASIAQMAHQPEFMERFLEAKNPRELRQFLLSLPRRRFARRYLS